MQECRTWLNKHAVNYSVTRFGQMNMKEKKRKRALKSQYNIPNMRGNQRLTQSDRDWLE